jgi:Abnormal spindle-like microcephaly-assoc'd, ASPM-SPD-2-Hydin/Galactose oxidase, central domain
LSSAETTPITLSPPSLTWGLVPVHGAGEAKVVTVQNPTSATVTFKSITVTGDFAIASNTCGASVAARASCLVGVTFSPTALGSRLGALTFAADGPNSPQTVPLTGTGSGPLTVSPTSLVFGSQRVGTTSPSRYVTLTNHLTIALSISMVGVTDEFAISRNTCGASIGPGLRCFIEVTATPTAVGERTGQLTVQSGNLAAPLIVNLTGSATTTGLTIARQYHTATLLSSGMVLITGGVVCTPFCSTLASAELYDPATRTFRATGTLTAPRDHHTATLLNNGMVLIAGGQGAGSSLATAELYDPATGTFTATGNLKVARHQHTATLLKNGKVLIAGGFSRIGRNLPNFLADAELYDPTTRTFTPTGSLNTARDEHTATLLNNGMVLIAGGGNRSPSYLASAELYDPATATFAATGPLNTARYLHTATLLKNGMVLIAGGAEPNGGSGAIAGVELYNPETRTFAATGNLSTARYRPAAILLNNGMILVAGGVDSKDSITTTAELYNPAAGTFTAAGSLSIARTAHTITLLKNGMALAAGGVAETSSAELYDPATGTFTTTQ